jgi:hypothetical protein
MYKQLLMWFTAILILKICQTICFRGIDVNYALRCSSYRTSLYYANKDGQFFLLEFVALVQLLYPVMCYSVLFHGTF